MTDHPPAAPPEAAPPRSDKGPIAAQDALAASPPATASGEALEPWKAEPTDGEDDSWQIINAKQDVIALMVWKEDALDIVARHNTPASPPATEAATLRAALERIRDWSDCQCEHATDDCCANCSDTDFHCPGCIAARALAADQPATTGEGEA